MSRVEHYHEPGFPAWLSSLHLDDRAVEIVASLFALFFIFSVIWVFFDARSRQKSGCIAMLFIMLVGWPLSFLWWLWLRPPMRKGSSRRTA
jgi:hypothetical protein